MSHVSRLMSQPSCPIEFSHVWKRYRIGSKHDSLRDAIPAFFKRWAGRNGHDLQGGEFWALRNVSFDVKPAESLGIIGPNGAGKSTALKLLSRICKQTQGDIRVRGRVAALIEVGAGFHPDLTGRENIYLNGTIMGLRHKQIDQLFDSIVAFSEIEKFLDMPIKRYSSGMTVRLGFAIAAHVDPEVLLVDEVLAVGDLSFQQKCYQRILDLKACGTTIVFISHNLEAVQRLCDRALLLQEGQVAEQGLPAEVIARYRQSVLQHQQSAQQRRSATAKVGAADDPILLEAELLNGDGQIHDTFETGDTLRLRLRYDVRRPIRQPSVTVTVERYDGLMCHEASTLGSEFVWPIQHGSGALVLEYPELNLLPNTYKVTVSVYEAGTVVPLAHLRDQLYFHVISDHHARGTVHLDHGWSFEPEVLQNA